jgi:hypothetical protein
MNIKGYKFNKDIYRHGRDLQICCSKLRKINKQKPSNIYERDVIPKPWYNYPPVKIIDDDSIGSEDFFKGQIH